MLKSDTFFGSKRETQKSNSPFTASTNPLSSGTSNPLKANNSVSTPVAHSLSNTSEINSQLIVGLNIKLKGVEITDCDTLVVEGRVEAIMNSRIIHIAEKGAFKGSAEIDLAEIYGEFDGDMTAREKLVIYSTGRVSGKVRYGKIVIEEGGQLIGEVRFDASSKDKIKPTDNIKSTAVLATIVQG